MSRKLSMAEAVVISAEIVQALEKLKRQPKVLRYIEGRAKELADAAEYVAPKEQAHE